MIYKNRKMLLLLMAAGLTVWFLLCVPRPLFRVEDSTVLEDREGQLLGARIAPDGQWRFPPSDSIPFRFKTCLLAFEDQHFYSHPGVNPYSILRALYQNIRAGKVVSGGSTLTMQVVRLARPAKKRNIANKLIEMIWAVNLELRNSKEKILEMYVTHAPFGGNVVGLEAASRRYFNRAPSLLSWAESATLAVLPNAPSLIFPGRNEASLLQKRNNLLQKLLRNQIIDSLTFSLARQEPVPERIFPIPEECYHLLEYAQLNDRGKRIRTTLDLLLQEQVNHAVWVHLRQLKAIQVFNACALVAEVKTGRVLAYTGNIPDLKDTLHGYHVDVIRSPRSSGSILKPFLYTAMTGKGMLAPRQLLPDIPTRFPDFTPENFSGKFDGAVPASQALSRSLNVPAVNMLRQYGVESFYYFMKKVGMTTLNHAPDYYGLSLILGGAETTLWDLGGMYASMAGILRKYNEEDGFYPVIQFNPLCWKSTGKLKEGEEAAHPFVEASSVWMTLSALLEVNRPEEETGWEAFAGARRIAWKTGTSFGFRDAWAVGITRDYVVAVWAGNADGEGRSGLTGSTMAAPLMFEIFGFLPQGKWFSEPADEMESIPFCSQSGFLASPWCPDTDTLRVPQGLQIGQCPWHRIIHLDQTKRFRVSGACYSVSEMENRSWFVLPPAMEHYYRIKHPDYLPLPPLKPGCEEEDEMMEFIYPREMDNVFIPRQLDGNPGKVVFELAHRHPGTEVHWYLDNSFAGKTSSFHQMSLHPSAGTHMLTVVDINGNRLVKRFTVMNK
jgi:penicillin-binding protein 1C